MKKKQDKKQKGNKLAIAMTVTDEKPATLEFNGELTIYDVALGKQSIWDALHKFKELTLDLENVKKIDSAGFQLLLACQLESGKADPDLSITLNPVSQEIKNVFDQYGETI